MSVSYLARLLGTYFNLESQEDCNNMVYKIKYSSRNIEWVKKGRWIRTMMDKWWMHWWSCLLLFFKIVPSQVHTLLPMLECLDPTGVEGFITYQTDLISCLRRVGNLMVPTIKQYWSLSRIWRILPHKPFCLNPVFWLSTDKLKKKPFWFSTEVHFTFSWSY